MLDCNDISCDKPACDLRDIPLAGEHPCASHLKETIRRLQIEIENLEWSNEALEKELMEGAELR